MSYVCTINGCGCTPDIDNPSGGPDLAPGLHDITVFGDEPHGNYNRIMLSPVLAGVKNAEDIVLHSREWYKKNGITLHAGDPVVRIDRVRRTVQPEAGAAHLIVVEKPSRAVLSGD